jgi:hypothetical protein
MNNIQAILFNNSTLIYNKWFIIIMLIIFGIYISSDRYFNQVRANIIRSVCKYDNKRYSCNLIVQYTINNIKYTNKLNNIYQKSPFNNGDTIPIFYNPINPNIIQYGYTNFTASFICFLLACLLFYYF